MKLLHIIHSLNPEGGGPIAFIKSMAEFAEENDLGMDVATLDSPAYEPIKQFPANVHALGPGITGFGYTGRLMPWLAKNRTDYDLVVAHGLWQFTSFGTWLTLRNTDTPYVIYPHGMLDPWFNERYPLKHFKKAVYWPVAEYRVLRDADAVIFTTEEERRRAGKAFKPYWCREVVAGLGIDAPKGEPDAQKQSFLNAFPQLAGMRSLLFLGRLHEKKGVDLLLEAFAAVAEGNPELRLVIAGPSSDNYAEAVKQKFESRHGSFSERVVWTGMIEGDYKWGAFYAADAFILPSHQENFGIAVVESLACGTPVLISDKVNIWREVEDAGAGMVEEDSLPGVKNLLNRWLGLSVEQTEEYRRKTRPLYVDKFEIRKAMKKVIAALDECRFMKTGPDVER